MTDSRFSSISNILQPRPSAQPPAAENEGAAAESVKKGTVTRIDGAAQVGSTRQRPETSGNPVQPAAPSASRPSPASASASGGVRRVVFRLNPDLHRSLGERAAAERSSYGQVVLDAVESLHGSGRLSAVLNEAVGSTSATGLFPRLRARHEARPAVPVEIRLDARAVAILEQLVDEHGAENRTQLIAACLTAYLN